MYVCKLLKRKENALKEQLAVMACTHTTFLEPKSILYINFRGKLGFTDSKRVARSAVELASGVCQFSRVGS